MSSVPRSVVSTNAAPAAIGPYSQAIKAGSMLFCSGQLPVDPQLGTIVTGGAAEQAAQCLTNLAAVLEAAGTSLAQVVKTTVFLKNMSDFQAMNDVYAGFFAAEPPARSTVEVARLPKDVLVEIEAVAILP